MTRLIGWRALCALALPAAGCLSAAAQTRDPLLDVLVHKGVIGKSEADHIAASPPDQQRGMLALLLERKGVLTAEDVRSLGAAATTPTAPLTTAGTSVSASPAASPAYPSPAPSPQPAPVAPSKQVAQRRSPLPDRSAAANQPQSANDAPFTDYEKRESPLSFRIGNAEFTPGGFIDFTTIFRSTNTGNLNATSFGAIPFSNTVAGHNTETRLSASATELNLKVKDRLGSNDVLAFVSFDFLGNDPVNALVDSNSHTVRVREAWADVRHDDWELLAGQVWGLQTPNRYGLNTYYASVFTTLNEDANYQVGLPWTRAPAIRGIYHASPNLAFAAELQNPDQFTNGEVTFPSAFNAQLGTQFDAANLTTAPDFLPDLIVKGAFDTDPGGVSNFHFEAGGLLSSFRDSILPTVTGSTFEHHTAVGGAGFASSNVALGPVTFIGTFMGGSGVGRYMGALGPDIVVLPINAAGATCAITGKPAAATAVGCDADLSTVKGYSGVGGAELRPWDGTVFAAYYGGVYFQRNFAQDLTSTAATQPFIGFGGPNSANSNNKSIQEGTLDWVQNLWNNQQYGTVQTSLQASYLTRAPWFVAAGAPKNAHLVMGFFSLKYILPP